MSKPVLDELAIEQEEGRWPDLHRLVGTGVKEVRLSNNCALLLRFGKSMPSIRIPAPWTFTSCLMSVSSEDCDGGEETGTTLIGLEGARLSAVERDGTMLDLVFDSIRINIRPASAKNDTMSGR